MRLVLEDTDLAVGERGIARAVRTLTPDLDVELERPGVNDNLKDLQHKMPSLVIRQGRPTVPVHV